MDAQKVYGGKRGGRGGRTKRRYDANFRRPGGEQYELHKRNWLDDWSTFR